MKKILGYALIFVPLILASLYFNTFWILLIGLCITFGTNKNNKKNEDEDEFEEKKPKQKKNKNYWLYIQLPAYYVGIVITILYLGVGFFDLMGYNTWLSCILAICYGYAIYKIILKLAKHEG